MSKEELFDKFLNSTLTKSEEIQFESLLQDEETAREFVEYTVEMRDYVAIAAKIEESTPRKTVRKKRVVKKRRSLIPVLSLCAAATLVVFFYLKPSPITMEEGALYSVHNEKKGELTDPQLDVEMIALKGTTLKFEDQTSIEFGDNTRFKFTSFEPKTIFLISGSINANVAKQENGYMSIQTVDGTVKVLGTEFIVSKSYSTMLNVSEGKVAVSNEKSEALVTSGKAALMKKGMTIVSGNADELPKLRWESWSREFRKDKDLRFYINFEKGLKNLAKNKFSYEPALLSGNASEGRFKGKKALSHGIVEFKNSREYKIPGEITVFSWFKLEEKSSHSPLITQGDNYWRMQLGLNRLTPHVGYGKKFSDGPDEVEFNKWHLMTAVFTDNRATIYFNGVEVASLDKDVVSDGHPIQIGGNAQNPERLFKGQICEAGLLERALTQEEIRDLFESTRP